MCWRRHHAFLSPNNNYDYYQCVIIIYTFADRIAHRTHGRCKGAAEDRPTVSAHLLAAGPQGAHIHQLSGRTHEHGRKVETEDRLWARRSRIAVSVL